MKHISSLRYRTTGVHRAQLVADFTVDVEKGFQGYHEYEDEDGFHFATLNDDFLTLHAGWGWDKCSPSVKVFGRWFGTYSGTAETFASAIHDATRAILAADCSPFTRKMTDDLFWDALVLKKSRVRRTFHTAVASPIGSFFMWLTRGRSECSCLTCPPK